jgi:hypothetical protein
VWWASVVEQARDRVVPQMLTLFNLPLHLMQKAATLSLATSAAVAHHTQSPISSCTEEQQLSLLLAHLQMWRTAHAYAYAFQAYALITMDALKYTFQPMAQAFPYTLSILAWCCIGWPVLFLMHAVMHYHLWLVLGVKAMCHMSGTEPCCACQIRRVYRKTW